MPLATMNTILHRQALAAFAGILIAAVLAAPSGAAAEEAIVGTASVIDGDTIEIHGTRIRLHGIDAPESRQECHRTDGRAWRCGQQAALALSERIGRAVVRCDVRGRDRYGRTISVCLRNTEDLNRWMVVSGWAVAYRKYALDYVADEERAHLARVGIWSGAFEMPWDWRLKKRE
jgi:endonuclease YncB( thermonuclease family)